MPTRIIRSRIGAAQPRTPGKKFKISVDDWSTQCYLEYLDAETAL
jgi:hypothetical protein